MVEILDRERVAVHRDVAETVDSLLRGEVIPPETRTRLADGTIHTEIAREQAYRPDAFGGGRDRDRGRRSSYYDDRNGGVGHLGTPRRQIAPTGPQQPRSPSMRRDRAPLGGQPAAPGERAFQRASGEGPFAVEDYDADEQEMVSPKADTRAEQSSAPMRANVGGVSVSSGASATRPLRVYPFGVSRNRLEQAIKTLRVPAAIVREIDDADVVMTLKNYYRKNPQILRTAEQDGVPVYVLKSNTLLQIEHTVAGMFHIALPADPVSEALEETEAAINSVLDTARSVELAPAAAHIRKLQHQMAERYNLGSTSKGREPFRRVRIFRQE
jgi:hypothetical protein